MGSIDIEELITKRSRSDEIDRSAWDNLIRMMGYKAESADTRLLFIDRYDPTSQICSGCMELGRIGGRETIFQCELCDLTLHRDISAVKNIFRIAKIRGGTPEVTPGERMPPHPISFRCGSPR